MKNKKFIVLLLAAVMFITAMMPVTGFAASVNKTAKTVTAAPADVDIDKIDSTKPVDVVVVYDRGAKKEAETAFKTSGLDYVLTSVSDRVSKTQFPAGTDCEKELAKIKALPGVKNAYLSTVEFKIFDETETSAVTNDPYLSDQWWFPDVQGDLAYNTIKSGASVKVAVIDTGVDTDHPDLAARLLPGYDYAENDSDVNHDSSTHGTSCTGCIIGIPNNGIGICGVTGNANVKVIPYKTEGWNESQGKYALSNAAITASVYAAIDAKVDVISMSFGFNSSEYKPDGGFGDGGMYEALQEAHAAGITLVAAAGNDYQSYYYYSYPASYNNVISVAATTSDRGSSSFSQMNDALDVAAPGTNIYTTEDGGSYKYINGTSFSCPITAGICAMLISKSGKSLTPEKVESILKETCTKDVYDDYYREDWFGAGIVQAYDALQKVSGKLSAPTNVKAVATGATSIKVSWKAVEGATKYVIYRKEGSADWKALTTTTGTSATFKTNLKPGYNYRFRIYAKNATQTSAGSAIVLCKLVPPAPTGLKIASTGVGKATITWNKVDGITGYCVYYKRADDSGYTYAGATTATSKTISGLTTGARYAFKIRCYVNAALGVYAGTNVFGPYCTYVSGEIIPGTPTGLTITSTGVGKATIKWNKVAGAYAYCIYYKCSGDSEYTYFGATTATSKTVTGLQPGRRAAFKIRCYYKATDGPKAGQNVFSKYCTYVSDAIPLAKPANFRVTSVGSGSATIAWSAVKNAKGYCLYYKCAGDEDYTYMGVTSTTSMTFTGLNKGKQYAFKIRAYSGPYAGAYIHGAYTDYVLANIPK